MMENVTKTAIASYVGAILVHEGYAVKRGSNIQFSLDPTSPLVRMGKKDFKEFIDLLNDLRKRGTISAAMWREFNRQWEELPQERDDLVKHLRSMLKET